MTFTFFRIVEPRSRAVAARLTAGATLVATIGSVIAASSGALPFTALYAGSASAQSMPAVVVTGVSPNNSSAKIFYQPVVGAKDYRVSDVASPSDVKYAGNAYMIPGPSCPGYACQNHFVAQADGVTPVFPYQIAGGATGGPQVLNVPATDIEWNALGDNQPHTLVVEAVDALGPVPQANLYTGAGNTPLAAGGMLGSNKGPTADGKLSTNGQGPFTNNPRVIATSPGFVVQANPNLKAIPSNGGASQTFYDTFDNSEGGTLHQTARNDGAMTMKYSLNAGTPKEWEIEYQRANTISSMPFIASNHFMDMLFDGGTPGQNSPTHNSYGSMGMSPKQTFDISGGKVLHMTMEVDAHQDFRRWLAFNLAPASDPLTGWDPFGLAVNTSDQAIFLEQIDGSCTLKIFTGPADATHTTPAQVNPLPCGWEQMYNPNDLDINGLGRLDQRSRLDFFISQNHAALFEDDRLISQADIPAGSFGWANAPIKAYFSHYLYHTDADLIELLNGNINQAPLCYPLNSYWFNDPINGRAACGTTYPAGYGFTYSDERHWDNMGLEVLPAGAVAAGDFSSLLSTVKGPAVVAPSFTGTAPTSTPTAVSTSTPTAVATKTATAVPTTAATPTAVAGAPTATPAAVPAVVTYLSQDSTTQGTWKGTYGTQGYSLVADAQNLPAYAQMSVSNAQPWTWAGSTSDMRAIQKSASATDRLAAGWSGGQLTVDMNLTDNQSHKVSLYNLDWDGQGRSQKIDVLNPSTGVVVDSRTISAFTGGTYLTWSVSGHVQFRITRMAGPNAVLSGVFVDGAASPTVAAFVGQDTTHEGTWKGTYGSQGYMLEADGQSLPSSATVSVANAQQWTWAGSTSDVRAMQKAASATDRLAAGWYGGQFTADVNLTDGQIHKVSLYQVDWDGQGRSQKVEVLNASSGAVLDSRTVSAFSSGAYLSWNVGGHVTIRITASAGPNAVVNGILLDP